MTTLISRRYALLGALAAITARPVLAASQLPVDTAIVFALDVSTSVIDARWELQRGAYRDAFLDPDIIARISQGPIGRIAVTVVEWATCGFEEQVVPWTLVSDQASGAALAMTLANMPRAFSGRTCVGGGLYLSMQLLLTVPFEAARRVIDISGDGPENDTTSGDGRSLEASAMRDLAIASGIVINGLPILLPKDDRHYRMNEGVEEFYRDQVIGGNGSFMITVPNGNDPSAFIEALRRKFLNEIS